MTEPYTELGGRPGTPAPATLRGCGNDCSRDYYAHPDRHICPWRNVGERIYACGCVHEATKRKKRQ